MSVFIQQLLIVIYQKIKSESFVDSLKRFLGPELSVWPDLKLCIESGSRKGQVGVWPRVLVAGQELCDRNLKNGTRKHVGQSHWPQSVEVNSKHRYFPFSFISHQYSKKNHSQPDLVSIYENTKSYHSCLKFWEAFKKYLVLVNLVNLIQKNKSW
jgi:hypothetical protein